MDAQIQEMFANVLMQAAAKTRAESNDEQYKNSTMFLAGVQPQSYPEASRSDAIQYGNFVGQFVNLLKDARKEHKYWIICESSRLPSSMVKPDNQYSVLRVDKDTVLCLVRAYSLDHKLLVELDAAEQLVQDVQNQESQDTNLVLGFIAPGLILGKITFMQFNQFTMVGSMVGTD